jgi:hypothetical protein
VCRVGRKFGPDLDTYSYVVFLVGPASDRSMASIRPDEISKQIKSFTYGCMIRYAVHDGGCIIGMMVRGLLGGPSREPCRAVPTGKTPYQLDLPVFRILVRRVVRGLAALHVVGLCFFLWGRSLGMGTRHAVEVSTSPGLQQIERLSSRMSPHVRLS